MQQHYKRVRHGRKNYEMPIECRLTRRAPLCPDLTCLTCVIAFHDSCVDKDHERLVLSETCQVFDVR